MGRKEGFPDRNFKIENTSKILKQLKGSQADKIMHFYSVFFHTFLLMIRQGLQQVGSQNLILTYPLQPESIIIFFNNNIKAWRWKSHVCYVARVSVEFSQIQTFLDLPSVQPDRTPDCFTGGGGFETRTGQTLRRISVLPLPEKFIKRCSP